MERYQGWSRTRDGAEPGRGAVPRGGRGTQGWGRYPGTGARPRDGSTAPGWSHAQGWAHDSEAAQASLQPQPFCSPRLQHGLRLQAPAAKTSRGGGSPRSPLLTPSPTGPLAMLVPPIWGSPHSGAEAVPRASERRPGACRARRRGRHRGRILALLPRRSRLLRARVTLAARG